MCSEAQIRQASLHSRKRIEDGRTKCLNIVSRQLRAIHIYPFKANAEGHQEIEQVTDHMIIRYASSTALDLHVSQTKSVRLKTLEQVVKEPCRIPKEGKLRLTEASLE